MKNTPEKKPRAKMRAEITRRENSWAVVVQMDDGRARVVETFPLDELRGALDACHKLNSPTE